MTKMVLMSVLVVSILGKIVSTSQYIPPSWAGICRDVVASNSTISLPQTPGSAKLVDLRCLVPKSHHFHWKLNDLRDWIIDNNVNNQTTPSNRTIIYNLTVTCEYGANISLPYPMRVPGLRELHVTHCRMVDKYKNVNDVIDSTIANDMSILEIRHSLWLLNQTNDLFGSIGDNFNISSHYDCGQDSSLVTTITSNVSQVYVNDPNVDDVKLLGVSNFVGANTVLSPSFGDAVASKLWPKPEDRLVKDTGKVVSNHTNLDPDSQNVKQQNTEAHSHVDISEPKTRQAKLDHIKLERKIINTQLTKCRFSKLRVTEESIASMTPVQHFDLMIQGANYPVLEIMNFSYSGLLDLPTPLADWRIYFPALTHVDISHNYISKVKVRNYPSPLDNIVKFDLRYNNITFISMDILKSWADVENFFVDIRDNPIHCGCDMATNLLPFLELHSTFTGKLAPYRYVKDLYCHTPEFLAGTQLHALTIDALSCPENVSNKAAVVILGALMAVLVIIIIFIIRFKVEIRILLYTRLHVRLPCDKEAQSNSKQFDAFISYSNHDTEWVCENLIRFLEKCPNNTSKDTSAKNNHNSTQMDSSQKAFKLCVHQRDFIPGKTIFDNIVDSIEASRHTIIVLSPSFMRSHWALEELRQAYRQSLVEKTRHLIVILLEKEWSIYEITYRCCDVGTVTDLTYLPNIVILLEKVSKDEMDPLISRCCKTFTYLEVNDSLFKDRLVFSLTIKDRSAKRRDRLATKRASEDCFQRQESSIYDTTDEINGPDNLAYSPSIGRPSEPVREMSNMSTSSTTALACT